MEGQGETLRADARDVSRRLDALGAWAVGELLGADDHLVDREEAAVLHVHGRAQITLERPLECGRRHCRSVTESHALPKVERINLSVLRDGRQGLRGIRLQDRARLPDLVREVQEQPLRRVQRGPVVRHVGDLRVECVETTARVGHLQHTAAQRARVTRLLRCRRGDANRRRRDEQRNPHAQHEQGEHMLPAHMTPSIAPRALTRGPFEVSERHQRLLETPPRRQS